MFIYLIYYLKANVKGTCRDRVKCFLRYDTMNLREEEIYMAAGQKNKCL